ncbi:hypothetical protein BHM03_00003605 [Ensete ventricosum]|nr:hypothetical protein BHM03_00003605 [Ensete ventricosum]
MGFKGSGKFGKSAGLHDVVAHRVAGVDRIGLKGVSETCTKAFAENVYARLIGGADVCGYDSDTDVRQLSLQRNLLGYSDPASSVPRPRDQGRPPHFFESKPSKAEQEGAKGRAIAATVRSEDWSFSVQFLGLDLDFALFSPRVRREAKSWCLRESYRVLPSVVDSLYM